MKGILLEGYSYDWNDTTPSFPASTAATPKKHFEEVEHIRHREDEESSIHVKDEIRRTLVTLFEPGSVVELRALNAKGWTRSGYFDDHDALAEAADELDRLRWQVYVTLNRVDPDLLARAANKVVDGPPSTTSDKDIIRRRWLPLDIDPVRPSGVSATREEKRSAYELAREVRAYLEADGWPEPVIADSGNGFYFLYRVDLPNDQESRERVKGVLKVLAAEFDDDRAKIDPAVHNAARIVRLFGTTNRKGKDTEERPHRRSKISMIPQEV